MSKSGTTGKFILLFVKQQPYSTAVGCAEEPPAFNSEQGAAKLGHRPDPLSGVQYSGSVDALMQRSLEGS